MIGRFLDWLGRHATSVLFLCVFAALALPGLAATIKPLFVPVTFLLLVFSLLRLDWKTIPRYVRQPTLTIVAIASLLIATPVCVWWLAGLAPLPSGLVAALVLTAAAAPLMSSPALALLLGLEAPLVLLVMLGATALVPLTLPPLVLALLDLDIEIGLGSFMARLAGFIVGAVCLAGLLKRIAGKARLARYATRLDGANVLILLVFAIAVMDGVTAAFIEHPTQVLLFTAAAFALNASMQLVGAGLGFLLLPRGRRLTALTLGLTAGSRNLAMIVAVLADSADADLYLFLAVVQFPIYMLPAMAAPLYRWLLRD